MLSKIGNNIFYSTLLSAGFKSLDKGEKFYRLGLVIGSGEVTLKELVRVYSIFANNGFLIPERKVIYYKTNEGKLLSPHEGIKRKVFDEKISFLINSILSDNYSRGLGFSENSPLKFPYQVAVKTGTSEGFRNNFCIGYTRDWTVGVWVGNFDGKSMKNVSGISGAGPIFHSIMDLLQKRKYGRIPTGEKSFERAPDGIVEIDICPLSGMLPSKDCEGEIKEYFIEGTEPKEVCNWHRSLEIDIRNGLLATLWTPKKFRKEKIFLLPPPSYTKWAERKGFKFPPQRFSELGEHEFKISHPVDGSIFQSLPDLPKEYQTIRLEVRTDLTEERVIWMINGKVLGVFSYPYIARWNIEKGFHEIVAMQKNGKESDKIKIYVQ